MGPCHCGVKHAMALVVLAICAGFAAPAPCPSTNGHLRFGTISYRQVSGYTVTFTIETQWRRSYSSENVFAGSGPDGRAVTGDVVDVPGVRISDSGVAGPVVFQTGDGAEHPLSLTVTHHSLNETEDFLHGYSILQHTYRAPNDGGNDWLASLSGCCRQYGPEFREFFITARVNLALDGQSLRAKSLPVLVITSSPVLHRIRVVANTYMGSTAMAWRIGQGSELGTATMPPKAAADFRDADSCGEGEWEIDPATGLAVLDPATGLKVPKLCSGILSLNGSALGEGCHPLVVQIASIRSVTPYDCIVHVIAHHMEPLRPVFFGGLPLVTEFDAPGIRSPAIPVLNGYAGYQIYFTLSARSTRPGATLADVRSFALPEGAVLVNYTAEGIAGDSVLHVDFKWTPLPAQAQTHFVCFEAIDQPAHGEDVLSSGQHCVRLQVNGVNPAPVFQSPAPNTTVRFYMAVPNAFEISGENANPYDNIVLTSQFPLTVGQTLSPPIASEKRIKATDTATRVSATATLYWTPGITLGAYDETICFVLSQAGGPGIVPASSTRCVLMLVERCKYVTQAGDDMKKVGQIFQSDWLSLWGLNVHLDTFDPEPGTELLIGRLYVVQRGDTLLSIAREFGTTIEGIKRLNYDLAANEGAERGLVPFKPICIFPDTCTE